MSFRKRNVGLSSSQQVGIPVSTSKERIQLPGVRPSPIDGRPTTSTGSATLDGLLAGHAGLALGSCILIEESGTTDYAGALLRFYAAEGLVQGHHVHVFGPPEQWGRELPGLAKDSDPSAKKEESSEKMKIAWRYERLGQFGSDTLSRERVPVSYNATQSDAQNPPLIFCHSFDLTRRLVHPPAAQISFIMVDQGGPSRSPWDAGLARLFSLIASSPSNSVHRIVIPSLLSPALYPPQACMPQHILKFQHGLRALLAAFPGRLTIMQSLPLSLYPRSSGVTCWLELLADGVIELTPFPHSADAEFQSSRDPATKEEPPQGLLKTHRLPLFHDRGSGYVGGDVDWSFTLSRRKFIIKPFNLPPVEGDTEAQQGSSREQKPKKVDMEF